MRKLVTNAFCDYCNKSVKLNGQKTIGMIVKAIGYPYFDMGAINYRGIDCQDSDEITLDFCDVDCFVKYMKGIR